MLREVCARAAASVGDISVAIVSREKDSDRDAIVAAPRAVVRGRAYPAPVLWDDDSGLEELAEADDADELCRRLLESPRGWGSSTRHTEAVGLLRKVHGTGELADAFVALLLCTCGRWDRVTARLIAAIEESGLLPDADLDELAESFLAEEVMVVYPLAWVSPQWLEVDLSDGTGQTVAVDEETPAECRLPVQPPLRRWAARRALRARPERLGELLRAAEGFQPRHRDALIHGLLDAADVLEPAERRRVVRRGLRTGQARVRRAALEQVRELDGPDAARRRARSDPDATVRAWRPTRSELPPRARMP